MTENEGKTLEVESQTNFEDLPETWQTECKIDEYVKFENSNNNTVRILFLTNSFEKEESMYGPQNVFKVKNVLEDGIEQLFATSSKRCMFALSQHFPIKNKTLEIAREGTGMEITYEIKDLS